MSDVAIPPHLCLSCGKLGQFGYATRTGSAWVCIEHRSDGEAVLVRPDSVRKG